MEGFVKCFLHSPNLTPLGFLSSYVKDKLYAMKPATVAKLKVNCERECTQVPRKRLMMSDIALYVALHYI